MEEPNVGIWYLNRDLIGQPVRLAVDLIEVILFDVPNQGYQPHAACSGKQHHPFMAGGPTRLSAGPYQYTQERDGEVFATNEPGSGQEWFLIPRDRAEIYV